MSRDAAAGSHPLDMKATQPCIAIHEAPRLPPSSTAQLIARWELRKVGIVDVNRCCALQCLGHCNDLAACQRMRIEIKRPRGGLLVSHPDILGARTLDQLVDSIETASADVSNTSEDGGGAEGGSADASEVEGAAALRASIVDTVNGIGGALDAMMLPERRAHRKRCCFMVSGMVVSGIFYDLIFWFILLSVCVPDYRLPFIVGSVVSVMMYISVGSAALIFYKRIVGPPGVVDLDPLDELLMRGSTADIKWRLDDFTLVNDDGRSARGGRAGIRSAALVAQEENRGGGTASTDSRAEWTRWTGRGAHYRATVLEVTYCAAVRTPISLSLSLSHTHTSLFLFLFFFFSLSLSLSLLLLDFRNGGISCGRKSS